MMVINMIKEKMTNALNKQMNAEFYSAYLYQSMSAYFEAHNLRGFAHWMQIQAKEEWDHGMRIYRFLIERGGIVRLDSIKKPPASWKSPLKVFQDSYKHEKEVTGLIDKLLGLARANKDHASEVFLQWFVNEQVEEEAQALEVVEKLKMIKDNTNGIFMMDHHLGQRKAEE
jgi:ferritin